MQKPCYDLSHLAEWLDAKLQGSPHHVIDGLADIQEAGPSQASFVANRSYQHHLHTTSAGVVLLREDLAGGYPGNSLIVADPYLSYARLSGLFERRPQAEPGIHSTAVVSPTASVSAKASVGPFCVVEDDAVVGDETELAAGVHVGAGSRIGRQCRLHPKVTLYHGVTIGDRVTIHSATVIGSDGFGFAPCSTGWEKIHQLGGVIIGDQVEIGAGCTIDRGALTDTVIARGVIIDNQVHIAHNVRIGEATAIAGCCGIAGSTEIGARCLLGGGVLVSGHLKIADGVQFNGATVVTKSIRDAGVYSSGAPVQPVKQWQKNAVRYGQLNELFERVKSVEQRLVNTPADDGN